MSFRFGPWELDTERYELRHQGQQRKLEPKVFELLAFLLRHHDRVVSREEILAEVWQGRVVSDSTLSTCVKAARQAIGDDGQAQRLIRTVHGRGFRFVGALTTAETMTSEAELPKVEVRPSPTDGERRTSVVVLPFAVFSDAPELAYLADGLVEDLTTLLARTDGLLVISRSSSFAYKGQQPSARQVRQALGVDCMVEGSVRLVADQLRINVQLIDTRDEGLLWARRFDCPALEIDALQDDIHSAVGRRLAPQLAQLSYSRLRNRDCDGDAWLLYQQACGLLAVKGWHPDTFAEAMGLLRRSIDIAPFFAPAHAFLALLVALGHRVGLLMVREEALAEGLASAEHALRMDDRDSTVLGYAGCALADLGQQERAIPILEKAVEQDPSNAQAWAALGAARIFAHQLEAGLRELRWGIKISPLDNRLAVWGSFLAIGQMLSGALEQAVDTAQGACRSDVRNHIPRVTLAAVALAANQPDAASAAMAEALRLRPELSIGEVRCLVGDRSLGALREWGLIGQEGVTKE